MAPVKFGLFKARSRDHQEQPSTENLLQSRTSLEMEQVTTPGSPLPSTSKGFLQDAEPPDLASLHLDSDDDASEKQASGLPSEGGVIEDAQVNYKKLKNQSADVTSISTLQYEEIQDDHLNEDDASTSCDVNSIQFDMLDDASIASSLETSIAASSDISVNCGAMRKLKKDKTKKERLLRDFDMWRASNVEVMQNLLSRSGTMDDQIKWEAIATARGLCTLTENCSCRDCIGAKYLAGIADGDGGLGTAPLFGAISFGCVLQ